MSDEKRIEEKLERVAKACGLRLSGNADGVAPVYSEMLIPVLRRELLPLLKAGQWYREQVGDYREIADAWDAALGGSEEAANLGLPMPQMR